MACASILSITRLNSNGGTCIDWIMITSDFVKCAGTTNYFISDHLTTYIVQKKLEKKMRVSIEHYGT